jgi:hypothetical protein
MFLDIIHRLAFIEHIVLFLFKTRQFSETGFCLRLQVEPIQLGSIEIASPYLRAGRRRQNRVSETLYNICMACDDSLSYASVSVNRM